ncbi:MAG: hypothetical protein ABMA14_22005 [Hyphomonadaceae bacterium]
MDALKFAAAAVVLASLGACASAPPPTLTPMPAPATTYKAALLAPCDSTADAYPWLLKDSWEDGDAYAPITQFRPDGVMLYGYGGKLYDNGRWSIEGASLHMDTNNHYADYDGAFDGTAGKGTMKNEANNTGTWTLERDCDQ